MGMYTSWAHVGVGEQFVELVLSFRLDIGSQDPAEAAMLAHHELSWAEPLL